MHRPCETTCPAEALAKEEALKSDAVGSKVWKNITLIDLQKPPFTQPSKTHVFTRKAQYVVVLFDRLPLFD